MHLMPQEKFMKKKLLIMPKYEEAAKKLKEKNPKLFF